MSTTTWRKLIEEKMAANGERWVDVLSTTLSPDEMGREFDDGYGAPKGVPFTLWTRERVYFPSTYDGAEGVRSVPRHPCQEMTRHVGGGGGFLSDDDDGEGIEIGEDR